jgi:hypothetical protein
MAVQAVVVPPRLAGPQHHAPARELGQVALCERSTMSHRPSSIFHRAVRGPILVILVFVVLLGLTG